MELKLQKFACGWQGGGRGKWGQQIMWLQLLSFAFGIYSDDHKLHIRVLVFFLIVTVNY